MNQVWKFGFVCTVLRTWLMGGFGKCVLANCRKKCLCSGIYLIGAFSGSVCCIVSILPWIWPSQLCCHTSPGRQQWEVVLQEHWWDRRFLWTQHTHTPVCNNKTHTHTHIHSMSICFHLSFLICSLFTSPTFQCHLLSTLNQLHYHFSTSPLPP